MSTEVRRFLFPAVFESSYWTYPKTPYYRDQVEHQKRVAKLAVKIAKRLVAANSIWHTSYSHEPSLAHPEAFIRRVKMAALTHDIGKRFMPPEILYKPPGPLLPEQRQIITFHPLIGWELLKRIGMNEIAEIVRHHHEKWDGSGYPDRLAGNKIPWESRILAVADVACALGENRAYQRGVSVPLPINWLEAYSGKSYDADITDAAIKILKGKPIEIT